MIAYFDLKKSLSRLLQDLNYSLIIVMTLAFSLGVSLFLYAQIHAVNYKNLEFDNPESIVSITRAENGIEYMTGGIFYFDFTHYDNMQTSFSTLARYEDRLATLTTDKFTERVQGAAVNAEIFSIANTSPLLGRVLTPADNIHGSAQVAIIGYDLWFRLFDSNADVLGALVNLNGLIYNIVGVMPKGFKFPISHEIWVNYPMWDMSEVTTTGWNTVIGQLKPGVSIAQAQDEMNQLAKNLQDAHPASYTGKGVSVKPYTSAFSGSMKTITRTMLFVAIAVLLMGCFSVANLLIVKTLEQSKESLIKSAIGIRPWRVAIPPLLESFWLCMFSGFLGLWVCYLGIKTAGVYVLHGPYWWSVTLGRESWLAAAAFMFIVWILAGILPVIMAHRTPTNSILSGGRKGGASSKAEPMMNVLISMQVICAFVLMVFTGMSLSLLSGTLNADYGVDSNNKIVADIRLSEFSHSSLNDRNSYFQNLSQSAIRTDHIRNFAYTGALPGFSGYSKSYNSLETNLLGESGYPKIYEIPISENFLDILSIKLISGRYFLPSDKEGSGLVAIIDERTAEKIWGISNPIGKKIQVDPENNGPLVTIIGTVENTIHGAPLVDDTFTPSSLYRPMKQVLPPWATMYMVADYNGNAPDAINSIKNIARNVDSQVALSSAMTYEQRLQQNASKLLSMVYNFMPASLLALIMAALGIYGITARLILQKTGDIGIMKAIGARNSFIIKLFMKKIWLLLVAGLTAGVIAMIWLIPFVSKNNMPISKTDLIFISFFVAMIIFSLVSIASFLPLYKVNKLSPQLAINSNQLQ